MEELKKIIESLARTFEEFKAENDKRLQEIETKGYADPLLTAKVETLEAALADMTALKAQMEQLDTLVARQGALGNGNLSDQSVSQDEHRAAFEGFIRRGENQGLRQLELQASLSTQSDPDGGFTVPETLETAIDRVLGSLSAMRQICATMTIGTGTYKKLVSQGGTTSGWVGEEADRDETVTPTLRQIAIEAKEVYAKPAATQSLLEDSAVDIEAWLADEVAIEFSEEEGSAFITGNGVAAPMGILSYDTVANASYSWGKIGFTVSGAAAALTDPDALVDLQHALKAAYRNGGSWLMNDLTMATVRKLKDNDNNYLWKPGLELDAPATLLGKPVAIDDTMPDIAAGAYPIAFGNFSRAYLIVDRRGVRVIRDEVTAPPYVKFYTTRRVGGGILLYEALKLMKISV